MPVYSSRISEHADSSGNSGSCPGANARGRGVSLVCGCAISFAMRIQGSPRSVENAKFGTNGCGYMIAAANVIAESVKGKILADLHGLDKREMFSLVEGELGELPSARHVCIEACLDALRMAFADFRRGQIEEFRGEEPLICTCFGIGEDVVRAYVVEKRAETVDVVTRDCRAGGGCGSCRMLIQEIIDGAAVNDHPAISGR